MEPSERDWGPKIPFWALVVGKGIQYVQSSTYNLLTNIILVGGGPLVCWTPFGSFKTFYGAPKGLYIGPKGPFLAQLKTLDDLKGAQEGPMTSIH